MSSRMPKHSLRSQMLLELLTKNTLCLKKQGLVDGLMGYVHVGSVRRL